MLFKFVHCHLLLLFSHSVMSDSLRPHGLQHARLPCTSLSLGVAQTHAHWIGDAFQPSHPLLPLFLLPSVFPSIRVFSNESTLCIRWPKDGNFSFTICSAKEYLKLISLRIDWIDLLAFQGTLERVFSNSTVKKNQFFSAQPSLWSTSDTQHDYWRNHSFDYTDLSRQSNASAL